MHPKAEPERTYFTMTGPVVGTSLQYRLGRLRTSAARTSSISMIACVFVTSSWGAVLQVPGVYPDLHSALAVAVAGDSVVVSPGVYSEWGLLLPSGVTLLGTPEDPTLVVVDGALQGRILYAGSGTVCGLTFRHGNAGTAIYDSGGGLRIGSQATVSDCVFEACVGNGGGGLVAVDAIVRRCRFVECVAIEGAGGSAGTGGGALLYGVTLEDCVFEGNSAHGGGAARIEYGAVVRCEFRSNHADDCGGLAAYLPIPGTAVRECTFANNTSLTRFGGAVAAGAACAFEDCLFVGNSAVDAAGAVGYARSLVRCRFQGNRAARGGAIAHCYQLTDCVFTENTADAAGGASFSLRPENEWPLVSIGCVFYANEAPSGGAIYAQAVNVSVDRCTFVANRASNGGSALALVPAATTMSITRSILGFSPLGVPVTYWTVPGVPPLGVHCTDVFGNAAGDWVGVLAPLAGTHNNFASDPLFCDWVTGDFTLYDGSPCLPPGSPCGEQVGALALGCGAVSVKADTWGRTKARFR